MFGAQLLSGHGARWLLIESASPLAQFVTSNETRRRKDKAECSTGSVSVVLRS